MSPADRLARLDKLVKRFEKLIYDFDIVLNHHDFYLDDHIDKIKNDIDIQRETLIDKIHKISKEMIDKLDKYNEECKVNRHYLFTSILNSL
jgi:hypothetical protein